MTENQGKRPTAYGDRSEGASVVVTGAVDSRSAIRMRAVQDPVGLAHDYIEARSELARTRALLKKAHDRDKWQGEFPSIAWYDEVARYFKGQVPSHPSSPTPDPS